MTTATDNRDGTRRPSVEAWIRDRIRPEQIEKYLDRGRCFIDAATIERVLAGHTQPDPARVREILQKSLAVETLTPDETACLIHVQDPELLAEMQQVAAQVKMKVYDNRIVTFAPLYLGNLCVNNCAYCGFRDSNESEQRRVLTLDEVRRETEVLAGQIGHKRLIVVYGEHPKTGVDYIASTLQTIGDVKVKTRKGWGQIRRCNVNAAPMSIEELKTLHEVGIGTFQVFQETYHRPHVRTAASSRDDQGRLPLASLCDASLHGGGGGRCRSGGLVGPLRLEVRGDGIAVSCPRTGGEIRDRSAHDLVSAD